MANKAQQRLEEIEKEISELQSKFPSLPQMWKTQLAEKQGILLGLEEGKKKVVERIEKSKEKDISNNQKQILTWLAEYADKHSLTLTNEIVDLSCFICQKAKEETGNT